MLQTRDGYLGLKKAFAQIKAKHLHVTIVRHSRNALQEKGKRVVIPCKAKYGYPLLDQILPDAMGFSGNLKK